jgi:hypothetical protein
MDKYTRAAYGDKDKHANPLSLVPNPYSYEYRVSSSGFNDNTYSHANADDTRNPKP